MCEGRGVVEQVKTVRAELDGQAFLARTELLPQAQKAPEAGGMRPPPQGQPLNKPVVSSHAEEMPSQWQTSLS